MTSDSEGVPCVEHKLSSTKSSCVEHKLSSTKKLNAFAAPN